MKKLSIFFVVLTALSLLILSSSITEAQVTLSVGNGSGFPGSPDNQIAVTINNPDISVHGLQMEVMDEDDYLTCTGCTPDPVRAPQFQCQVQEQVGGECRLLLFTSPSNIIEEGIGAIFTIDYTVNENAPAGECRELNPESVTVSDVDKQSVDVTPVAGDFCFTLCSAGGECDDGNECTNDSCEGGQCTHQCTPSGGDDPCCTDPACFSHPLCIDPLDADHDGIPDSEDNCPDIPNETQTNSDNDTYGDDCDNCSTVTNEDQGDSDVDGRGDACDYRLLCGDVWPQESAPEALDCGDGVIDIFDTQEMIDIILGSVIPSDCQSARADVPNGPQAYCGNPPGTANCESDGEIDIFDTLVVIDKLLGKVNCIEHCLCGIDSDADDITDSEDNCPDTPNDQTNSDGDSLGDACDNCPNTPNEDQTDTYPPGSNNIGDACDCEGDFDCDGDCDGSDAALLKADFGRSGFNDPCVSGDTCNGDFDCDNDCDGTDAALFKQDFGRSGFNNPCPTCVVGDWCNYPSP